MIVSLHYKQNLLHFIDN